MEPQNPSPSSLWPYATLGALFLTGFLAVAAWNIEIPYLAYSAGPVSDALGTVQAEGVEVYTPRGDLLMLTIVSQNVNLFEAVLAGFDPTIDLVREEAVRRVGESDEEYRSRVLQQMDDSNFRSIVVALRHLGFEMVPIEVVINEFVDGVPAAEVLNLGDAILAIDGFAVSSIIEIGPLVQGRAVGSTLEITVARDGNELDLTVELAERTDLPDVAMIGVILGEITEPPFPLAISAGDVGGPSAGMMHALAIIDTLTEGDITKGHVIAGTGTISVDGTVGGIGGVRQKVVAAEAAGASHILVPQDNYEAALTAQRTRIEIVPVATLDDALDFLENLAPA